MIENPGSLVAVSIELTIERPGSLAAVSIDDSTRLLVFDLDGTFWPNEFNPDRQPPFMRISRTEVRTGEGETLSLKTGLLELLNQARVRNVMCSIASMGDPDIVLPLIEQFGFPIKFRHSQLGWDGKDSMVEEILRVLEAEDGIKVSNLEVMFVDDDEKNLLEVGNRFPGARLVKAP